MEKGNDMLVSRHLDEVDDLKKYGRDAPLEKSASNLAKLDAIAEAVYQKMTSSNKKAIIFITSPRLRAKETAQWVADKLREKGLEDIKIRFSSNDDLRSTEQGDFIIPEDYVPGDFFEGLSAAASIFTKESHMSDISGMEDNIHYKFGDPILMPDGSYKYPELAKFFKKSGESYAETLARIYESVLDFAKKYHKLSGNTELVVVAHGQIYHVLRGLSEIHRMVTTHDIEFKPGDSVKLLWQIYNSCDSGQKVTGICMPMDFSALGDPHMMDLLKKEMEFMRYVEPQVAKAESNLENLRNLQKDLEAIKQETGLECFLAYGSLLRGVEYVNDLDIIVVVKRFTNTQSIFDAVNKHFPSSKLDFHIYLEEEVSQNVSFFTREYVLEYLAKGLCLCGENLFQKKFSEVTPAQYKESIFIRSVEHVQMVRKTIFSNKISADQKLGFLRKYLLRVSINTLLFNDVSSHEELGSMSLPEVIKIMQEKGFLDEVDIHQVTEGSIEETFAIFSKVSNNLLMSRQKINR